MKSESERDRLLSENLPDAFACCQIIFNDGGTSRDCIFLEINTAFEKMIGLKREKVIGQKASAVLSETRKTDPFWNKIYDKVTSSEESVCFESYYEPPGRWYDVSLYKLEPDCFTVVFHDITERKQEKKARRQSEGIYQQILDNVSDVVWITNMDLETTYVSPSVEVMLGESVSEHMSKRLDQKFPPSSLEKIILIAQKEIEKEKEPGINKKRIFLFEAEHYRADGSTIQVNMHLTFLRDDMGNISGILGVTRDISKLKKAEKELQESEARSKALIEAIPDMLYRINRDGVFLEAIVKDEKMLHETVRSIYRQKKLPGKTITDILPVEIATRFMATLKKALVSGKVQLLEFSYKENCSDHCIEARLAPIGDVEIVLIVRDITIKKRQEIELQYISYHDELTGLYNRRYYENELERLNSSREHPIAIISADLDNLKKINDSLGHNEGDHYIQAAAEILKSSLRESDILARVGGDEFAVILPRTTLKAGRELVKRIHHQIEIYNQQNTSSPTLSISVGIAVSTSGKQPLEKIYNKADDAMYEDKKQHRK
ncbi:MAG: diguanylate cyclase [Bacillota bacterium]|nr:diguanylate cyclase [Bacillota bacterium]